MRTPSLVEISAFVAVAEHASFTKAATHLGVSASALGGTIRALEERLGVRLLNRTTRSVALTDVGERVLVHLRPVLDSYANAIESISAICNRPASLLRLTASAAAVKFALGPILGKFLDEHPDISIEITSHSSKVDIVAGRFDAGIDTDLGIDRNMVAVRISDDLRVGLAGSPAYFAKHPVPQTPHDLKDHKGIQYRTLNGAAPIWYFSKNGETLNVAVVPSVVTDDGGLLVRAGLDGAGLLLAAYDDLAPLIAEGKMISVLDDWMPTFGAFYLYYPSRQRIAAHLQALIDFFKKNMQGNDAPILHNDGSADREDAVETLRRLG